MTRMEAERRRRGWNQVTLAYHARVGQGDVSRIERRMLVVGPRIAARIGHALGIPAEQLWDEVPPGAQAATEAAQ